MQQIAFFDSAYQFKNELFLNKIKLSAVTYTIDKRLKSKPDDHEKKVTIEQIRFWRRNGLLPFFEEGDHAFISMAQYLWVLFLLSMKKFGCSVEHMKAATDYFIKRAYDDNLVLKNFLRLEEQYKRTVKLLPIENTIDKIGYSKEELLFRLSFIKQALGDPFLLHALKMDINYFTTTLLIYLESSIEISIVMNEQGVFGIMIDNNLLDIAYTQSVAHPTLRKDEPLLLLPIKHFLKEFFDTSSLEESALNIMVLSVDEKEIIKNLRDKKVTSIHIQLRDGEIKRYDIEKQVRRQLSDAAIMEIKKMLGLKNYQEITYSMINDREVLETRTFKRMKK